MLNISGKNTKNCGFNIVTRLKSDPVNGWEIISMGYQYKES